MSNTPKKQNQNNSASSANTSPKISKTEVDELFKDVQLEHSGFLGKIFKPLLAHFSFLQKKAVWVSLLVIFALIVLGGGGFSYYQLTKKNRPGYVLSTLESSFINKDAVLFSSIIDLPAFSNNFINDFINSVQKYYYVENLIVEIPDTEIIADNISFLFLDMFKDTEYDNEFNNKTLFIPKHISDLLAQAKFEIKEQPSSFYYETEAVTKKWDLDQEKIIVCEYKSQAKKNMEQVQKKHEEEKIGGRRWSKGRLIVHYLGNSQEVIKVLDQIMG